jgi:hypothetical protein
VAELKRNRRSEIVALHDEVVQSFRATLPKAIRIGELLIEQKAALKHGEFMPWIEANLPFEGRTIRLGKATKRQAEAIKPKIEQLVLAATGITGVVDDETGKWLTGLDEVMYDRLAAVGLVAERTSVKLGSFVDSYIKERSDVKSGTATFYGHTRRNLIDFFGEDKPLCQITPGDADQWRIYLLGQGLAENTARRRCGMAKQFFRVAVRRRLIPSNPFEDLKAAV